MVVTENKVYQIVNARSLEQVTLPEGSAVKGRGDSDDSVDGRKSGKEKDDQQHGHVEVIGARGLEDSFLRHITAHHSPALQVHGHMEPEDVQGRQAGSIESTHPGGKGYAKH